ncbi:S-adenosyl-L-methionine-dependent methyltransferase [Zopfochytrium polystomum]|nr:S-adenosyl-L-methionine-dependent methyltransferase [Zopfochytrium polystomum]
MRSVDDARRLVRRAILIKEIAELWVHAASRDELIERTRALPPETYAAYRTCTFKFQVTSFGVSLAMPEQIAVIERFSFLPFDGDIVMKDPHAVFAVYEDYEDNASQGGGVVPRETPARVFFGKLVATGGDRGLIKKYNVKKRGYIGITTMDAELSLLMSNQALIKPGSFVLDPFVGTGSFLFTSAHYGAFSMGSDIDWRQIRGKDGKDIRTSATQYGLTGRILGNVVCDFAHHPWRPVEFWDAIVCDPPYGVRAGAKKIAVNPKLPPKTSIYNKAGHLRLPQTVAYELDQVLIDILAFAAAHLVPLGRLVYWLPTIPSSYTDADLPRHPRMRLVANCEQNFGKWARRMVTMEKLAPDERDVDLSGWVYAGRAGAAAEMALREAEGGEEGGEEGGGGGGGRGGGGRGRGRPRRKEGGEEEEAEGEERRQRGQELCWDGSGGGGGGGPREAEEEAGPRGVPRKVLSAGGGGGGERGRGRRRR